MEEEANPEDIFDILVATDVHLGFEESDPVRGDDSFIAFEEVLALAVERDVDLILLAGDLFHYAKPTPRCLLRCTQLMRQYCFGDKPVAVELLSDQMKNFGRAVNYEDPNINISYPIFSIHGNHDDPVGQVSVSSLDILSQTGLVNYFGKWSDYSCVNISPVLMRKGSTNLALYGLSHLKDQRLARLFKESKVEMERPNDGAEWFNLLALHQNRSDRGALNFIHENVLPGFLDLVVWGHEHECRVKEEFNHHNNFYVTQPGSTVATSLAVGESIPKHCALLQIYKNKFKLTPIPLKTVRPFVFKTVVLSEENLQVTGVNECDRVKEFLAEKVHAAIDEAKSLRSGHPHQPELPLVRLSVFYEHDGQSFNLVRFGQQFSAVVANPADVLIMKMEKRINERKHDPANIDGEALENAVREEVDDFNVESLLERYYRERPPDQRLSVLSVRAMGDAVKDFTMKNNDETFRKIFEAHSKRYVDFLMKSTAETEDEVAEQIALCKVELDNVEGDELRNIMNVAPGQQRKEAKQSRMVIESSDEEEPPATVTPARGRGRGSRGGRGSRVGRGVSAPPKDPPTKPPTTRSPRAPKAAQSNTSNWLSNIVSTRSSRQSTQRSKSPIAIDDDSD